MNMNETMGTMWESGANREWIWIEFMLNLKRNQTVKVDGWIWEYGGFPDQNEAKDWNLTETSSWIPNYVMLR